MRGRTKTDWWGVVLEAPDGQALARFYSEFTGWPIAKQEPWRRGDPGAGHLVVPGVRRLAGLHAAALASRGRPAAPDDAHIDIAVDDLATAVADAIGLGATLAEFQPQDDVRVLLDPAGHPFCLYLDV